MITKSHAVARITARRGDLLAQASATLDLAATIAGYGDSTAADELLSEARGFFTQAQRLAPAGAR